MLLSIIQNCWTLLLIFIFVFLPIVFVVTLCTEVSNSSKPQEAKTSPSVNSEPIQERITPEVYRTVKKEAGSYEVHAPNGQFAVVIKVPYVNEGTFWAVALAAKDGKRIDRIKTKKEAVAAAIELLKGN